MGTVCTSDYFIKPSRIEWHLVTLYQWNPVDYKVFLTIDSPAWVVQGRARSPVDKGREVLCCIMLSKNNYNHLRTFSSGKKGVKRKLPLYCWLRNMMPLSYRRTLTFLFWFRITNLLYLEFLNFKITRFLEGRLWFEDCFCSWRIDFINSCKLF